MKLKRMLALVLTIAMVLSVAVLPVNAASSDFTDVAGHWAEGSIERWTKAGVIQGYGDGTFAPDDEIKRAEVAEVMRKVLGLIELDENVYTDVPAGSWYEKSILACAKVDMFEGYGDGTMKPEDPTRRIEMFKVLVTAFLLTGGEPATELAPFSDKGQVEDWAKGYTATMIFNKAVGGYEDGTLRPIAYVTRAQLVTLLDRIIGAYVTAEGEISLTSKDEIKGNIVLVNANCENNVHVSKDGTAVKVEVVGGKSASYTTDTDSVYVVIVNEDSAEVTDVQSVKVVGATEEKQAYIETVEITPPCEHPEDSLSHQNHTGCCAAGRKYEIYCDDCEKVIGYGQDDPSVHTFDDDGICVWCGEGKNDACHAQKFHLAVESNGTEAYVNVTDDYAAELVVEYGEVDAGKLTVSAKMNEVASLGGGMKAHEITVMTGLANKPSLHSWLGNAWEFGTAWVEVNVEGTDPVNYTVYGNERDVNGDKKLDAVIVAEPDNVTNARNAWQEITSHLTPPATQATDDSKIIIANGSSVTIYDETLKFEDGAKNLVLDNFNDLEDLKNNIKDHVVLVNTGSDKIEIVIGAGTTLAVGQTSTMLKDVCTITVEGVDETVVAGVLANIQTAAGEGTYALLSNLVTMLNKMIAGMEGKEIAVHISFAPCEHTSAPVAVKGCCAAGVEFICACGVVSDTWTSTTHTFVDGICTVCGEPVDMDKDASHTKFYAAVKAGGSVEVTVTDDYVAVVKGNYTTVNPAAVEITAKMKNVGSLGIDGVRQHSVTVDTGLTGDPDLAVWLSNAKNFKDATVKATVGGKAVTYLVEGDQAGTIVATPTNVGAARDAWKVLAENIEPSTGTDSKIIIANGSTLQVGGEKLVFETAGPLVLDDFSNLSAMATKIRESVKLVAGEATMVVELKAGTALAVGSSVATLKKDAVITITGIDQSAAGLNGILTQLKNASTNQAMAEILVQLINNTILAVDSADGTEVCVDITFG